MLLLSAVWGQYGVIIVNSVGTVWCYYCQQCGDSMVLLLLTVWGQYDVIVNSVGTVWCYYCPQCWGQCGVIIVSSVGTV